MANIVRPDGSILNENIGVKYRDRLSVRETITPSADQKVFLANNGLQWVRSSNVSGVAQSGLDLIIRFLNGSLYRYPNQGKLYDGMLKAQSKGRFVWVRLRRPKVPYEKIGTLPYPDDLTTTDEDIFNLVDMQGMLVDDRLRAMGVFIPIVQNDLLGLFRP